jgi:hypothetical protein
METCFTALKNTLRVVVIDLERGWPSTATTGAASMATTRLFNLDLDLGTVQTRVAGVGLLALA